MSENLRQSLSALMDGETDELELRRLLGELDKSDLEQGDELRGTWSRYQQARSVIKNEYHANVAHIDLSQGVAAAIAQEPFVSAVQTSNARSLPAWLKPISAIAVAASVAMLTVFGVSQYETLAPGQLMPATKTVVASATSDPTAAIAVAVVAPPRAVSPQLPSSERLSLLRGDSYALPASYADSYSGQRSSVLESNQQARRSQLIARQRLDAYLLRHAEHAALNNSQGMMPLARVERFEQE